MLFPAILVLTDGEMPVSECNEKLFRHIRGSLQRGHVQGDTIPLLPAGLVHVPEAERGPGRLRPHPEPRLRRQRPHRLGRVHGALPQRSERRAGNKISAVGRIPRHLCDTLHLCCREISRRHRKTHVKTEIAPFRPASAGP